MIATRRFNDRIGDDPLDGRDIDPRHRIASPEMFLEAEMLPHLICSRPMFIGGANDEADQHGDA